MEVTGRVASLLEVGTGFHPELTGRENIYVNGAILGMSRAEVRRKFDEIVAFADVEKFLDTPVKRYSSGMHVRLAFSVAAHMEPEILIVDEVLAVGDAAFQEKCIGKMNAVAKSEGRTVLFVSHNMSAIQHLCSRAVLLRAGRILADGETTSTVAAYLSDVHKESSISLVDWADRNTTGEARITKLEVGDAAAGNHVLFGQDLRFRIHATFNGPFADPSFGLIIHDASGVPLITVDTIHQGIRLGKVDGNIIVDGVIPMLNLYPGRYFLSPWIMDSAGQPRPRLSSHVRGVKHRSDARPARRPKAEFHLGEVFPAFRMEMCAKLVSTCCQTEPDNEPTLFSQRRFVNAIVQSMGNSCRSIEVRSETSRSTVFGVETLFTHGRRSIALGPFGLYASSFRVR